MEKKIKNQSVLREIGAVCFQDDVEEQELSFQDILLDETLVQGEIWVTTDALSNAGGINKLLPGKRGYELLLRISEKYRILRTDKKRKPEYISADLLSKQAMQGKRWRRMDDDMKTVENRTEVNKIEANRTKANGTEINKIEANRTETNKTETNRIEANKTEEKVWKTDCYVIGRYKKELLAMQCFDQAVMGVLSEGGSEAEEYLASMLAESREYHRLFDYTQPILIYAGDPLCYGVLDTFARSLGEALEELGCHIIYFDITKQQVDDLLTYVGKHLKAVIGMQTYLFSVKQTDESFVHDAIGAPEYFFVFDHPIWLRHHLMQVPKKMTVLTPDGNYAAFITKYYGHKAKFFPPAGQECFFGQTNRTYDIVFLGTYGDSLTKELKDLWLHDRAKAHMVSRYILYMRQNIADTPEHALERLLDYYKMDDDPEKFEELFYSLRWTMLRLAHYYRRKVIETLLRSGFTIHVFGESWKNSSLRKYAGLVCHEQAVGRQALQVYGNARLSLNIMTWHKDGFTERIANAMLQKSVVVTDRTTYLEQNFRNGEELLMFSLDHLKELPRQIMRLLSDEKLRVQIAENGYRKAKEQHTWGKRAEALLQLMNEQEKQG